MNLTWADYFDDDSPKRVPDTRAQWLAALLAAMNMTRRRAAGDPPFAASDFGARFGQTVPS